MRGAARLGMITYGAAAGTIDLGNDPPMVVGDDEAEQSPIYRAVSWRWMTGTVLTGVTSILLMGAALMAALSNPNQFASLPDSFALSSTDSDGVVFGSKGDRMRPVEERVSNRQILQVSTVTRQGERDFIKLKPFAKINASLTVHGSDLASKVPAYDALSIFADNSDSSTSDNPDVATAPATAAAAASGTDDQTNGAPVEGEIALKVSTFPIADPDLEPSVALDTPEVEQIVRASAHITGDPGIDVASAIPFAEANDTGGASDTNAPFSALGVKIVPENVSNIAKSDAGVALDDGYQEKIIAVVKSENLRSLFEENAITGDDADEIIAALSQLIDVSRLRPGQKIRVAFAAGPVSTADTYSPDADPAGDPQAPKTDESALRPIRVSIYDNGAHQATVARADNEAFVRADEPSMTAEIFAEAPPEEALAPGGPPKVYDAIYQTALEQHVPEPLIERLIHMFAYDVDYQARIVPGDSIEILHSMPDANDKDAAEPEILFASLTLGGVTKRFYRFRPNDDGVVDYYDEEGKSAKKFLIRKPVPIGRMTSSFGWRVHPLLGYRRLHAGVDYAAPSGTPIVAAGNGIVEKAGRSSGYGNVIIVRHTNGYETYYGHQRAFAKGIAPGVRVHQGEVIGYVGSTGLSTGPHLHFEIRINSQPVDPLRIRLPRGRVLEEGTLTTFEKERDRIDNLLGNPLAAPTKVASVGE